MTIAYQYYRYFLFLRVAINSVEHNRNVLQPLGDHDNIGGCNGKLFRTTPRRGKSYMKIVSYAYKTDTDTDRDFRHARSVGYFT